MNKIYEKLDTSLEEWIALQKVFFVSTAPINSKGHINCSPKGGDSFRVLDSKIVAYQDLTGSGIETVAHLRENGRIIIMFCAFEGEPKILRLNGNGKFISPSHPTFAKMATLFPPHDGTRGFIRVSLNRISESCGFGVPIYEFKKKRTLLDQWAEAKGAQCIAEYRENHNKQSIDGLPGLP